MIVLQETTEWKGNTPNHIYALTDRRTNMVAYLPFADKNRSVVVTPRKVIRGIGRVASGVKRKSRFSTRGRKFVEVKDPDILWMFEDALDNASH